MRVLTFLVFTAVFTALFSESVDAVYTELAQDICEELLLELTDDIVDIDPSYLKSFSNFHEYKCYNSLNASSVADMMNNYYTVNINSIYLPAHKVDLKNSRSDYPNMSPLTYIRRASRKILSITSFLNKRMKGYASAGVRCASPVMNPFEIFEDTQTLVFKGLESSNVNGGQIRTIRNSGKLLSKSREMGLENRAYRDIIFGLLSIWSEGLYLVDNVENCFALSVKNQYLSSSIVGTLLVHPACVQQIPVALELLNDSHFEKYWKKSIMEVIQLVKSGKIISIEGPRLSEIQRNPLGEEQNVGYYTLHKLFERITGNVPMLPKGAKDFVISPIYQTKNEFQEAFNNITIRFQTGYAFDNEIESIETNYGYMNCTYKNSTGNPNNYGSLKSLFTDLTSAKGNAFILPKIVIRKDKTDILCYEVTLHTSSAMYASPSFSFLSAIQQLKSLDYPGILLPEIMHTISPHNNVHHGFKFRFVTDSLNGPFVSPSVFKRVLLDLYLKGKYSGERQFINNVLRMYASNLESVRQMLSIVVHNEADIQMIWGLYFNNDLASLPSFRGMSGSRPWDYTIRPVKCLESLEEIELYSKELCRALARKAVASNVVVHITNLKVRHIEKIFKAVDHLFKEERAANIAIECNRPAVCSLKVYSDNHQGIALKTMDRTKLLFMISEAYKYDIYMFPMYVPFTGSLLLYGEHIRKYVSVTKGNIRNGMMQMLRSRHELSDFIANVFLSQGTTIGPRDIVLATVTSIYNAHSYTITSDEKILHGVQVSADAIYSAITQEKLVYEGSILFSGDKNSQSSILNHVNFTSTQSLNMSRFGPTKVLLSTDALEQLVYKLLSKLHVISGYLNTLQVSHANHDTNVEVKYDSEACPICYEDFVKDMGCAYFPCDHKFCEKCSATWTSKNPNCPLCRKNVIQGQFVIDEEAW